MFMTYGYKEKKIMRKWFYLQVRKYDLLSVVENTTESDAEF